MSKDDHSVLKTYLTFLNLMPDRVRGINGKDMSASMRTVFYPAVIGWTLLGVWISTLNIRYQLLKLKKEELL
jgi:hypothetical protein